MAYFLAENNLEKIYIFTSEHFLIGHVVFVLIVKNFIKNSILQQIYAGYKKNLRYKFVCLKKIYKFIIEYFFIRVILYLKFAKNFFIKIRNLILPPKNTRYRQNFKRQNCLFQKDLQLWCWPFFLTSHKFCLLMKNIAEKRFQNIFLSF